jgi:hypothetical protein
MIKETITIFVIVAALIGAVAILSIGLEKQDEVTCYKLQQYAKEYATFYATESEKKMCEALEIPIGK